MSTNAKELQKLKDDIAKAKQERDRQEGQLQSAMDNLKQEYGVESIKEANEKCKGLDKEIEKKQDELERKAEELERRLSETGR